MKISRPKSSFKSERRRKQKSNQIVERRMHHLIKGRQQKVVLGLGEAFCKV